MGVLWALSACASTFSSYDSNFSCKNRDHGGCEHPMTAYKKALTEKADAGEDGQGSVVASPLKDGSTAGSYQGYKGAVYAELQALVEAPDTPLIVPAKTVRTLILPHTGSGAKSQRLYMSRFIFTVLEEARFVLGSRPLRSKASPFIDGLMSSSQSQSEADPKPQAGLKPQARRE